MRPALSIIVPVFNDSESLRVLLTHLRAVLDARETAAEIIVVDGGSLDDSVTVAIELGATVELVPPGRGRQLNAGLRLARGDLIWMLHADSEPVPEALTWLLQYDRIGWGRFDVRFDDSGLRMWLVAALMNIRSRITGICTGDQGIFAHRRLLERIGGVPEQPLMEDIELSRRLTRLCAPECPVSIVRTSARRWHDQGWLTTVCSMWWFRLRYWSGVSPDRLAREYHGRPG